MIKKVAIALAVVVAVLVGAGWMLGARVEMDGTGWRPFLAISRPAAHYDMLERNRTEQRRETLPVAIEASVQAEVPRAKSVPRPVLTPYWTDFRGPNRDGRYEQMAISTVWPATGLPLVWRQPVGGGYSSFVVAEGRAFTIEQRRNREVATAYDLATGRELWAHAWDANFREPLGGDGPRATPTWHEGRVYALGAEGELRCLDARTGHRIWSSNILTDNQAQNLQWGMAASPLIVDDKVIVLPGGSNGKSVAAYNKLTGEPVWRVLDDMQAYTSPMVVTLAGQRQLVVVSARRAMGLTVEAGALLWEYPWTTPFDVNVAQPVVIGENRVFLSASYGHGAALLEIARTEQGFDVKNLWSNNHMKNKFTTSVLYDGYLYGLDESILACMDAQTGELKWKGGRYGFGEVALASGHLIVTTESGEVALVRAAPERFKELSRFQAISGKTWNHPAFADGYLLVRNETEMACFRIGAT
jgi:outer membrane protein assembly factor BamB